jgi:hypothetical protein
MQVQRGSRGIALLILNLSAVSIVQEIGWILVPFWTDVEKKISLASSGVRKWVALVKNISIAIPD